MTRYDRYGEPIDDDEPTAYSPAEHQCDQGWLGEDHDGRPIPCLVCRPHLRKGHQ